MEFTAEREAVGAIQERFTEFSERKACEQVGIHRGRYRSKSKRATPDDALRDKLKDLAMDLPHFSYRRLAVLLRRDSEEPLNLKRVHRLYRAATLKLRPMRRK